MTQASSQLRGTCDDCGRAINETSDLCANCLGGDREPTLADYGGNDA